MQACEQKVKDLQNIIKQFTLKDGKSLSVSAIQDSSIVQQPVQITLSSPVATKPSFDTGIKSETTFGVANDDQASQEASGSKPKPTCDAT